MDKPVRRSLVQLVPRKLPSKSVCASQPPTTSTGHCSSSDNESIYEMECPGGWPSTLSVLETPERRRLRRLLKTNSHNPVIQTNEEDNSLLLDTSPYINSSPMQRSMEHVFTMFTSPPSLKTPKAVPQRLKNVHISSSPMRSFYFRQSPTHKPRLSANSGSSSGRVPLGRVNRVLELPLPSNSSFNSNSSSSQQENLVSLEWGRGECESGYASSSFNSSGGSRLENMGSLTLDHSIHVETPSKGLGGIDSTLLGNEFRGLMHHSSTPLKDSSNLLLSLTDGFIPEQASGPLEASVLDGINPLLHNFFLLPPNTTSPSKPASLKRKLEEYPSSNSEQLPAKRSTLDRFSKSREASPHNSLALNFDEGVNENAMLGLPADNFLVNSAGEEKWRMLVGETADQLLVTSWAKAFFLQHNQPVARHQSLRKSTLSAGLPLYLCSQGYANYYKLD